MSDLIELLETDYFQTGLWLGLAALAVGFLLVLSSRRDRPLPVAGVIIAAATMWALWILDKSVSTELWGLAAILAGALLPRALKFSERIAPVLVAPGAIWLAVGTEVTDLAWVRVVMVVMIPIGGYLISDFEKRHAGRGLGVIFYTLAALGVFAAIPETEWPLVLIAVAVPMTFLAWPRVRTSLGPEGAYVATAVYMIIIAHGGTPRPGSIVGAAACLGILLIEPVAMSMNPDIVSLTARLRRDWLGAVVASVPQFVVVALCSRVAARFTTVLPAFVTVVIVYVATMALAISVATSDTAGPSAP